MRTQSPNAYWIRWRDVGIRCFPRAGSSTITDIYGRSHNLGYFLTAPKKVCVVRDPWHRLMSVWHGMVCKGDFKSYSIGHDCENVNQFVDWVCDQNPFECDNHITAYWAFMEGYWKPLDHQLITMDRFMKSPPHGLDPVTSHVNQTSYPIGHLMEVDSGVYDRWYRKLGQQDYELFDRAEKSPL